MGLTIPAGPLVLGRGGGLRIKAGGAAAPFDFASVAGLKANYDGSLLAGADGSAIASWADQASVLGAATQATSGNRPTVKAAGINGLKVANFTAASSQWFDLPSLAALSLSAATVFMVVQVAADPSVSSATSGLWLMGSDSQTTHFPFTDSNVYDQFGTTARKSTGNPTPLLTSPHVYEVTSKAGGWTSWFDGTQHFTTATNTVGFSATPTLGRSGIAPYLNGYIGQWLLYDSDLSGANRTAIRNALKTKWATP